MNTPTRHRRRPAVYRSSHDRQAHTWNRFATILSRVRAEVPERTKEALDWSLQKKTRGFVIPIELDRQPSYGFGWDRLARIGAQIRFPELEAKVLYDDRTDTELVALYVHYTQRSTCGKASVGTLPDFDAQWMIPLLRDGLARWMNIFVVEVSGDTAQIAISGCWVAAHYWIDGYDDRRAARADRRTSEQDRAVANSIRGHRWRTQPENADAEIDLLQSRIQSTLQKINAREETGQPTDDLYAYIASLSGQIQYITSHIHRSGTSMGADPQSGEGLCDEDRFQEVVFSDLESSDFWPIHRVYQ